MNTRSLVVATVLLPFMARLAGTQGPPAGPQPRAHHVVFYDETRQRVLVAGGAANDARRRVIIYNDVWSFDGNAWSALSHASDTLLGARVDTDAQHRVVAFGGFKDSASGDVRVLDNATWRKTGAHPSMVAAEPGFVFDQARNRFVAFGGGGARRLNGEVWEFDGTRWTLNSAGAPPARGSHAMVYDPVRKKVVVFGGMGVRTGSQDAPIYADTWEFDGTAWTQRQVAGPPARLGAGITFDSKRSLVILFGGSNHNGVMNDLWSWNGTSWKKLAEGGPEPRVMGYIAYDRRRDRVVLFGGRRGVPDNSDLGDTWEWNGESWRRVGS